MFRRMSYGRAKWPRWQAMVPACNLLLWWQKHALGAHLLPMASLPEITSPKTRDCTAGTHWFISHETGRKEGKSFRVYEYHILSLTGFNFITTMHFIHFYVPDLTTVFCSSQMQGDTNNKKRYFCKKIVFFFS